MCKMIEICITKGFIKNPSFLFSNRRKCMNFTYELSVNAVDEESVRAAPTGLFLGPKDYFYIGLTSMNPLNVLQLQL